MEKIVISAIASTQGYSVITPVRHGDKRASFAGARSFSGQHFSTKMVEKKAYMNKGSRNNNTRAEILGDKECDWGYAHSLGTGGGNRKQCAYSRVSL